MEKAIAYGYRNYTEESIFTSYERPMRIKQLEEKRNSRYALKVALEEKKREKTEKVINAVKGFGIGFGSMAVIVTACLMVC